MLNEEFLHYIWFNKLFSLGQKTTDNESVEIIDVGQRNTDSGPDVFNAKLRIAGTIWAGNVEFHVHASDWHTHNHTHDSTYNSVILHVVLDADCDITSENGRKIPQLVLKFPKHIEQQYQQLEQSTQFIACADALSKVSEFELHAWLDRLLIERLEQKTETIGKLLEQTTNNWEEAFYITLARNFGFSTNAVAFELLAKSLPNAILAKHRDNPAQLEALIFGQAGFLGENSKTDAYTETLRREYQFLQHKFDLKPIDKSVWKFLRLRPANFPTIRLAELANLIYRSHRLFSQVIEATTLDDLRPLFACQTSDYWLTHYTFGEISESTPKKLAKSSIDLLIINTVVPFLFCYGRAHNNTELEQRATDLLCQLPAERNHITQGFAACGIVSQNAYDSQALVQLKRGYCDTRNCLRCRFSKFVLKTQK